MTKIEKHQGENSGWTIDLMIKQNINISKFKSRSSSSYIKLSKELYHLKSFD